MSKNIEQSFNEWHSKLGVDLEANSLWHNYIKKHLKDYSFTNANILEIGCGRGGFAHYFNKTNHDFKNYVAADFSQQAIDKARDFVMGDKEYDRLSFKKENIEDIGFDDNTFDFIFSFETIEHVPNPKKAISELGRVLKRDGILFLTTPNYFGFFGLYRIYLRLTFRKWQEVGQPINKFVMAPRTLTWLRNRKFKIVKWDTRDICTPFPGKKKVLHFNWQRPKFLTKWLGLQSFFICRNNKDSTLSF